MKYAFYDQAGALVSAHNDPGTSQLPENAIELTDAQFLSWNNYRANAGRTGVESIPAQSASVLLAVASAALILRIDRDADAIYGAVLGNREREYSDAYDDALAFQAAGYAGDVPPGVESWATAKGNSAQWAADDILFTAASWKTAQASIRAARLAKKEAARNAADQAALAVISAQWSGFVSAVRQQLGI